MICAVKYYYSLLLLLILGRKWLDKTKEYLEEKVNKSVKTNIAHIEDKDSSLHEIELSLTSRLRNLLNKKSKTNTNLSDFNKECSTYESLPICNSTTDILEWWKIHSKCLPLLAKLARKYLAIPASSTKSERVFSAGGRVVTSNRTSLEPGKVEALVVINRNKGQLNK